MIDLKPVFEHSSAIKKMFESQGWQFLKDRLQAELDSVNGKINDFMTMNRPFTDQDVFVLNELRAEKKSLELFLSLENELLDDVTPEVTE